MWEPDIMLNLDCTPAPQTSAGNQKKKPRWFKRKGQFSERKVVNGTPKTQQGPRQTQHGGPPPRRPGSTEKMSLVKTTPPSSSEVNLTPSASNRSRPSPITSGTKGTTVCPSAGSSHRPAAVVIPSGNPSKILAIDCEMVGTGPKGSISQLARCSLVSYSGDVVYDKYIKPAAPVTDYRSRWSGIRPRDLANATPYAEARKEILNLLGGKLVIGHAIHNDFRVLSYSHPASLTRDTSRFPPLNRKAGLDEKQVASLKRLTKAIFNREIQTGKRGHSSVEDARATMALYKVVEEQWETEMASKSKPESPGLKVTVCR
ncbi:interferon-stimulated 20 kDa exonuclease-like 2 [Nelusetta ayraudi]|uniref:interferon-stimulated 20 kDa exonuclease-like 2 n=1 Tax=Nelusetta ayraudi TaxID=303726 RepID=UPI003F71A577